MSWHVLTCPDARIHPGTYYKQMCSPLKSHCLLASVRSPKILRAIKYSPRKATNIINPARIPTKHPNISENSSSLDMSWFHCYLPSLRSKTLKCHTRYPSGSHLSAGSSWLSSLSSDAASIETAVDHRFCLKDMGKSMRFIHDCPVNNSL